MNYYQKNRDIRLTYQKQYYQENKQEIIQYTKNYYSNNKEILKRNEKRNTKIRMVRTRRRMTSYR